MYLSILIVFSGCMPRSGILGLYSIAVFSFLRNLHTVLLEKEMAAHSSVLAWRIPGTGDPDGLPSMGSQESDMTP